MIAMKFCLDCSKDLNVSEFWAQKSRPDGLQKYCKKCLYSRNVANPNRATNTKRSHLKRHYSMALEDYALLLEKYGPGCAVCSSEKHLCVDHNHYSGKVRAILCNKCNTALGLVNDDVELLQRLIIYVEMHNAKELT